MIRKYSFRVVYTRKDVDREGERNLKLQTINAADDLEAFTHLCSLEWYQNLDYDQQVVVTMTSEDIPIRKA